MCVSPASWWIMTNNQQLNPECHIYCLHCHTDKGTLAHQPTHPHVLLHAYKHTNTHTHIQNISKDIHVFEINRRPRQWRHPAFSSSIFSCSCLGLLIIVPLYEKGQLHTLATIDLKVTDSLQRKTRSMNFLPLVSIVVWPPFFCSVCLILCQWMETKKTLMQATRAHANWNEITVPVGFCVF